MSLTPPVPMGSGTTEEEIEFLETDLLLEAIFRKYGYDFRDYSKETLVRRIRQFLTDFSLDGFSVATGRVIREPSLFYSLLSYFSINVTSFFRDPAVYASLRKKVIPLLRTWPHFKIWDAGCATGEEAYSLAILLHEEGLLDRATIYATDLSQAAIETAKASVYPLGILRLGGKNYFEAGGKSSFTEYFRSDHHAGILDTRLRGQVTFARHNLAMDASFGEMQVVVCRNVLIYFNHELQNHVLEMFWESLENGGYLCLGDMETIAFTSVEDRFDIVDNQARIFKKRVR